MSHFLKTLFATLALIIILLWTTRTWATNPQQDLSGNTPFQSPQPQTIKTHLSTENEALNIDSLRKELDQIIKTKIQKNLNNKIFGPNQKDNFLINEEPQKQTTDQYIYNIQIPKEHQKTVRVIIKNGTIVVFNQMMINKSQNLTERYIHKPRYAFFQRIISLPDNADIKTITPIQKDGMMTIRVDKI